MIIIGEVTAIRNSPYLYARDACFGRVESLLGAVGTVQRGTRGSVEFDLRADVRALEAN